MIKIALLFLMFMGVVMADAYNFTELRYSDATGRYLQLEGEINFFDEGLDIKYPATQRELNYDKEVLTFTQKGKEVALDEMQEEQIIRYFDILRLLHVGDDSELRELFSVEDFMQRTLLIPLGSLKYYIKKIELTKDAGKLKFVKLFLKNGDNISINIDDEIR